MEWWVLRAQARVILRAGIVTQQTPTPAVVWLWSEVPLEALVSPSHGSAGSTPQSVPPELLVSGLRLRGAKLNFSAAVNIPQSLFSSPAGCFRNPG